MRIIELRPQPNWILSVSADDGRVGNFDVKPYLSYEAFENLKDPDEFAKVSNGGYFIEWACGADLSADTIEARWKIIDAAKSFTAAGETQNFKATPTIKKFK